MRKGTALDVRLRGARGDILGALRDGDSTVARLAGQVGLTPNGVRLHLARLEAEGLVEQVGSEPGETKSFRLYGLTAAGRRVFSRAYGALLGGLVAELSERGAARDLFAVVARRLGPRTRAGDRRARLGQALGCLRRLGGRPRLERSGGATVVALPQCPLADLSALHPEVCEFGRALVAEWTGRPVAVRCLRGDRPQCRFELDGP